MRNRFILITASLSLLFFSSFAVANDGIVSIKSAHSVKETADRLVKALKAKGMTVFIRINHTDGAKKVGLELRPTEVVIFGNPKAGTPLMLCSQSHAIDLPQKALIAEDANGQVWYSYNDPSYLAKRHKITGCEKAVGKVTKVLGKFSKAATKP